MAMKLTTEQTQNVWNKWYISNGERLDKHARMRPYEFVHRSSNIGLAFEDWLFAQGGFVKQFNGKRNICFNNEKLALIFILTWT